jgi:GNAT superfamily N-acetyltransferase
MLKDYIIRRATPADHQAILAFQRAAIVHLPLDAYPLAVLQAWWDRPAAGLESMLAAGRYHVGVYRQRLVGGGGWEPAGGREPAAVVRALFVDPAHHARGLGSQLLRVVEDAAVAAGFDLILAPAPVTAAAFYERRGYIGETESVMQMESGVAIPCRRMWKGALEAAIAGWGNPAQQASEALHCAPSPGGIA